MDKPIVNPSNLPARRSERVALSAEVSLRRSGKNNYRVSVFDISRLGCQVEFVDRPDLEELLWIKFEGLQALEAQVCWVTGVKAGLVFTTAIHEAVFDELLTRLKP